MSEILLDIQVPLLYVCRGLLRLVNQHGLPENDTLIIAAPADRLQDSARKRIAEQINWLVVGGENSDRRVDSGIVRLGALLQIGCRRVEDSKPAADHQVVGCPVCHAEARRKQVVMRKYVGPVGVRWSIHQFYVAAQRQTRRSSQRIGLVRQEDGLAIVPFRPVPWEFPADAKVER